MPTAVRVRDIVLLSMLNRGRGHFYEGALDRIVQRCAANLHDRDAMIEELHRALDDELVPIFRRRSFEYYPRRRIPVWRL